MPAFQRSVIAGFTLLALAAFAPVASADVQLSIHDGRVSIVAKDATVGQILTEWARVGRTKIVNVERIPGGPLTLELKDVPEMEALDVLLRTLSGYMAAPRVSYSPDASQFDAIIVMPTTVPPPSSRRLRSRRRQDSPRSTTTRDRQDPVNSRAVRSSARSRNRKSARRSRGPTCPQSGREFHSRPRIKARSRCSRRSCFRSRRRPMPSQQRRLAPFQRRA